LSGPGIATAKLSVLVIEDEPSVQAFLRAALERSGFQVTVTACGVEGLQVLQQTAFDAIISDMRTPGGVNGADVHRWLSENRPSSVTRLLFITGDTVNEETAAILRRTGVPCIEKPFRMQELLDAVNQLIGR